MCVFLKRQGSGYKKYYVIFPNILLPNTLQRLYMAAH